MDRREAGAQGAHRVDQDVGPGSVSCGGTVRKEEHSAWRREDGGEGCRNEVDSDV